MRHLSDEELLQWMDGEEIASLEMREHAAGCEACATRAVAVRGLLAEVGETYETQRVEGASSGRAHLQDRMRILAPKKFFWRPTLGLAAALLLCLGIAIRVRQANRVVLASVPNHALTPGAVSRAGLEELCSADGDDDLDPTVPDATERAVLAEYGIAARQPATRYQIDYLINPQLGGTNDIKNLWPQPYGATAWNAEAKDALERSLHAKVCSGEMDLATAQRAIAEDWIAAYKRYIAGQTPA